MLMCAVAGEIFFGVLREGGDREERDVVATTAKKPGAQKKRLFNECDNNIIRVDCYCSYFYYKYIKFFL